MTLEAGEEAVIPLAFVPLGMLAFRACGCAVKRMAAGDSAGSVMVFLMERCPVHRNNSDQVVTLSADEWVNPLMREQSRD